METTPQASDLGDGPITSPPDILTMRRFITTLIMHLTLAVSSPFFVQAQPLIRESHDIALIGAPSLPGMLAVTMLQGSSGSVIRFLDLENHKVLAFSAPLQQVGYPSFSVDGESVAFVGMTRRGNEVFTSPWNGGKVNQITFNGVNDGNPSWSVEGDAVIHFSENRRYKSEIYSSLVEAPFTRRQLTKVGGGNTTPHVSPDNRYLLYSTDRYAPAWNVCIKDLHSQEESCPFRAGNASNCRANWSPDGSRFVFTLQRGSSFDLYLYSPTTHKKRRLTSLSHKAYDAVWSPDGEYIAFAHDSTGQLTYTIKVVRLRDKAVIPVAKAVGSLRYLSWTTARPYTVAADLCPKDRHKTKPGVCGCGLADTDSDKDTIPDCIDGCPKNPKKHHARSCN